MSNTEKDALVRALRACRVEDGSPAPLFHEGDLDHIAYVLNRHGIGVTPPDVTDAWPRQALREESSMSHSTKTEAG